MAIGRPFLSAIPRRAAITAACSACVPWEKFSRATSIPASTRRSSISGEREAGPIVQTILVRGMEGKTNSGQSLGRVAREKKPPDESPAASRKEGEIVSCRG
jgi:hypothetical protein